MNNTKIFLLVVVVAFVVSAFGAKVFSGSTSQKQDVLATVLDKGEIRAAYLIYPPYFMKDPDTGKFSGIFYDITELIGKEMGMKINWTEEVGYADIFTGLDAGRYDLFAAGLWPDATRAKAGYFSTAAFYSVIKAWGRVDDHRFDNDLQALNAPNVRLATVDGAMDDIIAKSDFPNAPRVSLPQSSPWVQNLLNITSNKADVIFSGAPAINSFLKNNPGTLREIAPDQPLRIFANSLVVKKGEDTFKQAIDVAINEAVNSGQIDKILKKYESAPDEFLRPAIPYVNPK
jgi:ABC-type amino acid transport substrate-binding protein